MRHATTPAERVAPDEGPDADVAAFAAAEAAYNGLDADSRAWITALATAAMRNTVSFHSQTAKTVRRFEILRGILTICRAGHPDDEVLRALLEPVIGDAALQEAIAPGALVGSLGAAEAARFSALCDDFAAGLLIADISDAGHFRLRPAA